MWNTKKYAAKYAAMAVLGAGLASAATPASACGVYGYAPIMSYGGCGAYGYAMYHRPYYGYAAYHPRYYYRPYAYAAYRPMYRFYRPAYAYAGYFPRYRIYRPYAFAAYRPFFRWHAAYGCAC
jgi:hypothetical protein